MITPFRVLEEDIFPEVHSFVAHKLFAEGVRQSLIAKKLGITQAMVSKYMLKRSNSDEVIGRIGDLVINDIRNDSSSEDISHDVTELCLDMMQKGELCRICSTKNNLRNCNSCMNLGINDNRKKVIDNIGDAIKILENRNPVELMPEVMMNIAMKTDDAKSRADVASIPGRITKINNRIKAGKMPEFNSSGHLAEKLLEIEDYRAIMNIRYDKRIDSAIRRSRVKGVIIDKGGFGIEPCAYVLGNDAVDTANKAIRIEEEIR